MLYLRGDITRIDNNVWRAVESLNINLNYEDFSKVHVGDIFNSIKRGLFQVSQT